MGGAEKWQGMRWDSRVRTEENRRTQRKPTAHSQQCGSAAPIGRLALPGDDGWRRKRGWGLALRVALKTEDEAGGYLGAELMRAEVGGAQGVSAHTKRPAILEGQVDAAT
jgi:hypothetical protein